MRGDGDREKRGKGNDKEGGRQRKGGRESQGVKGGGEEEDREG